MPIMPGVPFNSPWNPIDPPRPPAGPRPVSSFWPGLTPIASADAFSDLASGVPGFSTAASAAGVAAPPAGPDVSPATQGKAQATAPALTAAQQAAVAHLPAPLRASGQLTPGLDELQRDHEYGWNAESELLYRRYQAFSKISQAIRAGRQLNKADLMPVDGIRLNESGSLAITVGFASGTYTVLTYRVPAGYYGWINYSSNEYTGTGFDEAGGALVWGIEIQDWWYHGYGAIDTTLGSRLFGLWNIAGGLPLASNQYVRFIVTYDSTIGVTPGGRVICTLQGWVAPQRPKES